jgi:pimeloyl-ACP methyl ester carboxylesterase
VLNSCETITSEFPPPPFDGLPAIARDPQALGELLRALRDRDVRSTPAAFGLLIKHPIDERVSDSYALPCSESAEILRDTAKVMASASAAPVRAAGRALIERFKASVLLVWSPDDKVFALADAERYAHSLADGRLVLVEDAYSFTPEDQPEGLAEAIAAFAAE